MCDVWIRLVLALSLLAWQRHQPALAWPVWPSHYLDGNESFIQMWHTSVILYGPQLTLNDSVDSNWLAPLSHRSTRCQVCCGPSLGQINFSYAYVTWAICLACVGQVWAKLGPEEWARWQTSNGPYVFQIRTIPYAYPPWAVCLALVWARSGPNQGQRNYSFSLG